MAPMVKVAPEDPSSSTSTCLVTALSWVNNYFFLVSAAPFALRVLSLVDCATAAALKASLSACRASFVSPVMVRTPLLPGIFMRFYAG